MNVLILANDNTANIPFNLTRSLNKSGHDAKLVMCKRTYIGFPSGRMVTDMTKDELLADIRNADVIHLNESVTSGLFPPERNIYFKNTREKINIYNVIGNRKKVVRYAHGTYIRKNATAVNRICARHNITQIVTTPDLLGLARGSYYLPQILPVDDDIYKFDPAVVDDSLSINVSHSPTDRRIKETDKFIEAVKHDKKLSSICSIDLIHNQSHRTCMSRRGSCPIHYDQRLLKVYGLSAVEGVAIGQIVLVGMGIHQRYAPKHPFIDVNALSFVDAMHDAVRIVSDPKTRMRRLEAGRKWVEEHHSPDVVIPRLVKIYENTQYYKK